MRPKEEWSEGWRRFGIPSTGMLSFQMRLSDADVFSFVVEVACRLGVGIAYDRTKYTVNRATGCRIQNEFGVRLEEDDAMTGASLFFESLGAADRRRVLDAIALRENVPRVRGDERSGDFADAFSRQRFVDAVVSAAMTTDVAKKLRDRLHDRYALAVIERDVSGPIATALARLGERPSRFLSAGPIKRKELLDVISASATAILDAWGDRESPKFLEVSAAVALAREGRLDVAIEKLRAIEAVPRVRRRIQNIVTALGGERSE